MTYLITIYILVTNFINSFIRSNKIVLITTIFFMILLFGGIYNCADDQNYQNLFKFVKANGLTKYAFTEAGFMVFTFISCKIGLSYTLYRALIGTIGLLLIQKTVYDFTKKYNFVFFLYFIYPFILDVIQIRNFLAASILVYSFRFLISISKSGKIKFIIGVMVASSIHYMGVFFLPFVFVEKFSIRQLIRFTLFFVPIFILITNSSIIPDLIRKIVGNNFMSKLSPYFHKANWGFLFLWAIQLLFLFLSYLCYGIIKNGDADDKWKIFGNIIVKLNIYLIMVCFPLVIFNANFLRLQRVILVLNYIVLSQALYVNPKKSLIPLLTTIFLILVYFSIDLLTKSNIISVLTPFFNSNSFL